jgi:hypothetical protein
VVGWLCDGMMGWGGWEITERKARCLSESNFLNPGPFQKLAREGQPSVWSRCVNVVGKEPELQHGSFDSARNAPLGWVAFWLALQPLCTQAALLSFSAAACEKQWNTTPLAAGLDPKSCSLSLSNAQPPWCILLTIPQEFPWNNLKNGGCYVFLHEVR